MKRLRTISLLMAFGGLLLAQLMGSAMAMAPDNVPSALKHLSINGQPVAVESIQPVSLKGPIYEVRLKSGDTVYSDAKGRRMVVGTLYDNAPGGLVNLTVQGQYKDRLSQIAAIPRKNMVVFPALGKERAVVTVFTDSTCPFCQALHHEISQINAGGVTVHYVPFPRAGSGSPAAGQLAQVLCSKDPQAALTGAFAGQSVSATASKACTAAVDKGYQMGMAFGVKGTPSIVLPDGEMGEGFVPADQLVQAAIKAQQIEINANHRG